MHPSHRPAALVAAATLGLAGLATVPAHAADAATTSAPAASSAPSLLEDFDWSGSATSDSSVRVNGDWTGSGGNQLLRSNASASGGVLTLTSRGNQKSGAEVQSTDAGHGSGYYEASLKASDVPGVLNTFFFMSDGYQAPEVDMEIRSRDNVAGAMHSIFLTVRQKGADPIYQQVSLPFDPADGFHRYGFVLGTSSVSFYADGELIHTTEGLQQNLGAGSALHGMVMSNTWAEDSDWVGPLPTRDASMQLAWIRVFDGATSPQG